MTTMANQKVRYTRNVCVSQQTGQSVDYYTQLLHSSPLRNITGGQLWFARRRACPLHDNNNNLNFMVRTPKVCWQYAPACAAAKQKL